MSLAQVKVMLGRKEVYVSLSSAVLRAILSF